MKIPTKCSILLQLTALALLLSGCAAPQLAPTLTSTPRINTATLTPTPSATFTPTIQATPTFPFPMGTEVSWPEPALSASDWQARYDQMMQTNGGCQLPCWWGITPGETTIQEAQAYLHELLPDTYCGKNKDGQIICSLSNSSMFEMGQVSQRFFISLMVQGVTITEIVFGGAPAYYALPRVLEQYGAPSEAWVRTFPDYYGDGVLDFNLFLYYPEKGLEIGYTIYKADKNSDNIQACFGSVDNISVRLWSPSNRPTFEELGYTEWDGIMLPFEDAIGITLEEFFTRASSQQNICVDTPASLWVMP